MRQKVPVTEALVTQLAQRALSGDAAASRDFLKIANEAAQARAEKETKEGGVTVIIRRFGEPTGCTGALEVLGVIIEVGAGSGALKLQPWVIEAALARGVRLSEADQALVGEFTVKADDVATVRTILEGVNVSNRLPPIAHSSKKRRISTSAVADDGRCAPNLESSRKPTPVSASSRFQPRGSPARAGGPKPERGVVGVGAKLSRDDPPGNRPTRRQHPRPEEGRNGARFPARLRRGLAAAMLTPCRG